MIGKAAVLVRVFTVALGLVSGALAARAEAEVTPRWGVKLSATQERRLVGLLRVAEKAKKDGEVVKTYLHLREAIRLEQLWSHNVLGEDSPANRFLDLFTKELLRREDGKLEKLLHSREVPLNDKLHLMKLLEDDVILNYPGRQRDGELLGGYEE